MSERDETMQEAAEWRDKGCPPIIAKMITLGDSLKNLVARYESRLIDEAMIAACGNQSEAARLLKMNRTTLAMKLKKRQRNGV